MHVVVEHKVVDREKLATADPQAINDGGPPGVQGLQTLMAADGSIIYCVWETPSIEALRGYLDPATAGVTENRYVEIDTSHSIAVPASVAARA